MGVIIFIVKEKKGTKTKEPCNWRQFDAWLCNYRKQVMELDGLLPKFIILLKTPHI